MPEHYQLIAGYVTIKTESTEDKDDCGNVQRIVETVKRDWDSYAYDIRAQGDAEGVKQVRFIDRTSSASTWASDNAGKNYGPFGVVYTSYGPIRPGLTYKQIKGIGVQLSGVYGPYNYLTNNCQTFASRLYGRIK